MYKTLNEHYKETFGCKVYKLSLDSGFTCPNRDGKISDKGCIFCLNGSSAFAEKQCENIEIQLKKAKEKVQNKNKNGKYIAYFQSFTNTYAPIKQLKDIFFSAIKPDFIVGISIATRPDCLDDGVIKLLCEINKIKKVYVELGLQTTNENCAKEINRGYQNEVYFNAVKRLRNAGINVVTHIIIGLPYEDKSQAIETTRQSILAGTNGVKFHLLHVLKNTELYRRYEAGEFSCLSLEEYAKILKECIAVLPPETVVHRITGDGAKKDLVAPLWSADKKQVLNYLNAYLKE